MEDEMVDVDIWEFSLDDEEIEELIGKLNELKRTRKHVEFDIDEDNELLIRHVDDEEEE